MGIGILLWVLVLGLAAVAGWFARGYRGSRPGAERTDALEILRQRYARGEVDREQFERMKNDLQH